MVTIFWNLPADAQRREDTLMACVLVAGLINIETTLRVSHFPIDYAPVRFPFFGINSTVSGVGYNVTRALATLGDDVTLLALTGQDTGDALTRDALACHGIAADHVLTCIKHTPQSVILYDPSGQRAIFTDLKDIQEQTYPVGRFQQALAQADLAVLCNINFTRPLLPLAKAAGVPIATDVHAISDIHDPYNRDYMQHADILFQSHERLPCAPEAWVRQLWQHYDAPIVVIGLGGEGALLGVRADDAIERVQALHIRPVVSTIGAGDALFSAFIHHYTATADPYLALRKAVVFAAYKIGEAGAADGFLNAADLDALYHRMTRP